MTTRNTVASIKEQIETPHETMPVTQYQNTVYDQVCADMNRYPLLPQSEVVALIRIAQQYYLPHKSKEGLTPEENQDFQRGVWAKNKVIRHNLRLIVKQAQYFANKYRNKLTLTEFIQEGTIGMTRAIELFDCDRGIQFSTYAVLWIRQAIRRAIEISSDIIRLPIHLHETRKRVNKARGELSTELGRAPKIEEVAERLKMSTEKLQEKLALIRTTEVYSLNKVAKEGESTEFVDLCVASSTESPENYVIRQNNTEWLAELLEKLTPKQQEVVSLRLGLNGKDPVSVTRISKKLGVSRETVRRTYGQAIKQLKGLLGLEIVQDKKPKDAKSQLNSTCKKITRIFWVCNQPLSVKELMDCIEANYKDTKEALAILTRTHVLTESVEGGVSRYTLAKQQAKRNTTAKVIQVLATQPHPIPISELRDLLPDCNYKTIKSAVGALYKEGVVNADAAQPGFTGSGSGKRHLYSLAIKLPAKSEITIAA